MIRYENAEDIVSDLQFAIKHKDMISEHLFQRILDDLIWCWTGLHGKVRGCPNWSKDALDLYRDNGWLLKGLKFQHEHSIPRKTLIEWFGKIDVLQHDKLKAFLEGYAVGVVVTSSTHSKLHKSDEQCDWSFLGTDISKERALMRYKLAGVEVAEVKWGSRREPERIEIIKL